jgi:hypothetical protein
MNLSGGNDMKMVTYGLLRDIQHDNKHAISIKGAEG